MHKGEAIAMGDDVTLKAMTVGDDVMCEGETVAVGDDVMCKAKAWWFWWCLPQWWQRLMESVSRREV
jgi:hypothetical protein